jgi:D-beta-D-heptose 7-phosphate kinase / D-beta-D-heptose 1-phosphate adenosyltransferase
MRLIAASSSDRPVNPLEDRLALLAALSCVDHVVPFADDTPIELIRSLRPNVFVKGGDYGLDELPEIPVVEELGGSVHILPYLENHSTTFLVERIRRPQSAAASAEEVTYAG